MEDSSGETAVWKTAVRETAVWQTAVRETAVWKAAMREALVWEATVTNRFSIGFTCIRIEIRA